MLKLCSEFCLKEIVVSIMEKLSYVYYSPHAILVEYTHLFTTSHKLFVILYFQLICPFYVDLLYLKKKFLRHRKRQMFTELHDLQLSPAIGQARVFH